MKSNFENDLNNEKIIGDFLHEYFYPQLEKHFKEISSTSRNDNLNMQFKGVDSLITFANNKTIKIDEKTALDYFDVGLPTFALEISFFNKDNKLKDGWLFSKQYSDTDSYLLCWGWRHDSTKDITFNNIKKIEAYSIRKKDLINLLDKEYDLNFKNYVIKSNNAMNNLLKKDHSSKLYLKNNYGPWWRYSPQKNEKCLNIVCPKNVLEKVTRYKFYITEDNLECRKV